MNAKFVLSLALVFLLSNCSQKEEKVAEASVDMSPKKLYMDVHDIGPGVTAEAVAEAHTKDLAVQKEFNVNFIKYWVDEGAGKVYCLAEAPNEAGLYKTHQKAHGLVPDYIMGVSEGPEAPLTGKQLFLDIHHLEPGSVTPAAVAAAHEKDLAVQGKRQVNFINYWVDQESGTVMCLSEAPDSLSVIETHREAHGLVPAKIKRVKQGS